MRTAALVIVLFFLIGFVSAQYYQGDLADRLEKMNVDTYYNGCVYGSHGKGTNDCKKLKDNYKTFMDNLQEANE